MDYRLRLARASSQSAILAHASQTGFLLGNTFSLEAMLLWDASNLPATSDNQTIYAKHIQSTNGGIVWYVTKDADGLNNVGLAVQGNSSGTQNFGVTWLGQRLPTEEAERWSVTYSKVGSTGTAKFYRNGVLVGIRSETGYTPNQLNTADARIGARSDGANYLDADINDFRAWNIELTQEQIDDYKFTPLDGDETGLVANITFNNTATDASPNGNDFTLDGSPTYVTPGLYANGAAATGVAIDHDTTTPEANLQLEHIDWEHADDLDVETFGENLGIANAIKLSPMLSTGGTWYVPITAYNGTDLKFYTVDTSDDSVNSGHDAVAESYEVKTQIRYNNLLYMGCNAPGQILRYDPDTDAFTDMGDPWTDCITAFSIALDETPTTPIIIIGASNGGTEVISINTSTQAITNWGHVGDAGHSFTYYVAGDDPYIYAAVRGNAAWSVRAIHTGTGVVSTVWTAADTDWNIQKLNYSDSAGYCWFKVKNETTEEVEYYSISGLTTTEIGGEAGGHANPYDTPPSVTLDDTTSGSLTVTYTGAAEGEATFSIPVNPSVVSRLIQWDANTLFGASKDYGPMWKFHIPSETMTTYGTATIANVYAMAKVGSEFVASGYPATCAVRGDFLQAWDDVDGTWTHEDANPQLVSQLAASLSITALHTGIAIQQFSDGYVWIFAMRQRYKEGFRIVRWDLSDNSFAVWNAANHADGGDFAHLQVAWVEFNDDASKILVSTRVEEDTELTDPVPSAAKLIEIDVNAGTWTAVTPWSAENTLGAVAYDPSDADYCIMEVSGVIARIEIATGTVVERRYYDDAFAGGAALSGIPRRGTDWRRAPDGNIWSLNRTNNDPFPHAMVRVDPETCAITVMGMIQNGGRMLFHEGDVYVAGASTLKRVSDVYEYVAVSARTGPTFGRAYSSTYRSSNYPSALRKSA